MRHAAAGILFRSSVVLRHPLPRGRAITFGFTSELCEYTGDDREPISSSSWRPLLALRSASVWPKHTQNLPMVVCPGQRWRALVLLVSEILLPTFRFAYHVTTHTVCASVQSRKFNRRPCQEKLQAKNESSPVKPQPEAGHHTPPTTTLSQPADPRV
ncbi:uncharacterized protein RBU33_015966 [Hipposideros larvatus]